jgi:hypothetical protein
MFAQEGSRRPRRLVDYASLREYLHGLPSSRIFISRICDSVLLKRTIGHLTFSPSYVRGGHPAPTGRKITAEVELLAPPYASSSAQQEDGRAGYRADTLEAFIAGWLARARPVS